MLRSFLSRKKPLAGAPVAPRMKTYGASSGYVYHYFFEGRRDGDEAEYVFRISTDRSNWKFIAVALPRESVEGWQREAARELNASERYAIVKLALFEVFDAHAVPEAIPKCTPVSRASLVAIAESLGWG